MKKKVFVLAAFALLALACSMSLHVSPTNADSNTWQVGASTSDCSRRKQPSYFSLDRVYVSVGYSGSASFLWGCGIRFTSVTIQKGSQIVTANLNFTANYDRSGTVVRSRISGDKSNNCNPLAYSTQTDFDDRYGDYRTTAIVNWDDIPAWSVDECGPDTLSPNLAVIVQEIVDDANWASGNAMAFFWEDFDDRSTHNDTAPAARLGYSYDGSLAKAPRLEVVWLDEPVNGDVSLEDADIGTQGVLAQKKSYSFYASASDPNGWTDIKNITVTTDYSIEIRYDNATDAFTEVDPSGYIVLSGSSSSSRSGDWINLTILITFDWDFPDESLHGWNMTTYDDSGQSDSDSYPNIFYVENDLIVEGSRTFYSTSSDGYVYRSRSTYVSCRTGPLGVVSAGGTYFWLGQQEEYGPLYRIWRDFLFFNTSGIPDSIPISSATLSIYGEFDYSWIDFNITIQNGQPDRPLDPLQTGDYNMTNYAGDGGSLSTVDFVTGNYNNITLNADGLTWINKTGTTKLCLRSSRDIDGNAPTELETITFYANEKGVGYQPKLVVTYTAFICDDDRGNINQTLTFNGTINYEGTTLSPPDAQITQIQIHDSAHTIEGTGSTTNGEFTISATAKSEAANTTYHIYINGAGDYGDGDVDGNDWFVSDQLIVYNLQPVQYLGDAEYKYEAQIKYDFDSATIDGAYANLSLPSGIVIGQDTSNSTGWLTFKLTQTNATETGTYKIFGVDDNNYGVTVAGGNQTFAMYNWTMNSHDNEGNTLTNTTITVTESSTTVWNGTDTSLIMPADTFNATLTWLESLEVNATTNLSISADTTTNFTCTCYPYTVEATMFWVASNATITSAIWTDNIMTITFSGSEDTYILVGSCTTKPVYILNCTYDYDTDFSTYLVLTHYANTTISLSHENWGGATYIQSVSNRLTSALWTDQKLRMYINGTSGTNGTLEINCGTRGRPQTTLGFTSESYLDPVFTGTYDFTSQVYCWTDWASEPGGELGGGGAGDTAKSYLLIAFPLQTFPTILVGQSTPVNLTFTFDRANLIFIEEVSFDLAYEGWFTLKESLPIRVLKIVDGGQNVTIQLIATPPLDAEKGQHQIQVTLVIKDGEVTHTVLSTVTLNIASPPSVPDIMGLLFLAMMGTFLVGTAVVWKKRR